MNEAVWLSGARVRLQRGGGASSETPALVPVEYGGSSRHASVTVPTKSQGESLIANVEATMKDEAPLLLCYVTKKARPIDPNAKP